MADHERQKGELSEVSKPFNFRKYFHTFKTSEKEDRKSMLNKFRPKKTTKTTQQQQKFCPKPSISKRDIKMTSSSTKTGICFICTQEFPHSELSAHEKNCLDNIQNNDVQYTRQNTDDSSTTSSNSITALHDTSNLSTHSSGSSNDSYDKKHIRCYICGSDVPTYLKNIHEKNCKKNWESGLLSSPAKKSNSKRDLTGFKSSSLTRGTSHNNLVGTDSKMKSKSTTNLFSTPTKKINKTTPKKSLDSHSRSTTQLAKKMSEPDTSSKTSWDRTKSLHDVRNDTPKATEKKKSGGVPKYVECQFCGKQYSEHSIDIHRRQCERTRHMQKNAGTEIEYKKKSRSMMDLSGFKRSSPSTIPSRPSTATTRKVERPTFQQKRPSTAKSNKKISSSMGNLHKACKTPEPTKEIKLDTNESKKTPAKEIKLDACISLASKGDTSQASSPGLQKCYLCGQIYGQRSLPIHEKQCQKKWERQKLQEMEEEDEKKKMQKRKSREIKLLPFGKVRNEEFIKEETDKNNETKPVKVIPSKLFGVESPLDISNNKKTPTVDNKTENNQSAVDNTQSENQTKPQSFERNLISKSIKQNKTDIDINENEQKQDQHNQKRPSSASKFVLCVFCGKQYGAHSISIHEKNCRERKSTEDEMRDRLFKYTKNTPDKKLSKSLGNLTDSNGHVLNGGSPLVTCDDCKRRFLSCDIEKHQIHCRVAIF